MRTTFWPQFISVWGKGRVNLMPSKEKIFPSSLSLQSAANSRAFFIEFKFEFSKNLIAEFKFLIFNFSSSSSGSVTFTTFMLSSSNFYLE